MEVQTILESKEHLIKFFKDSGFQEEKDYDDEEYKEGTYFKIDKRKLLVIYEILDEEKLKEVKDHFLIDAGISYCLILFNRKVIFFRNFGENKHFIYSERTKNNSSKINKLENIKNSIDILFQSKDISAKFYESFKFKRNILAQSIKNDVDPVEKYLISQKIFDRFFFIYFLCHKGIIKFEDGGKISGDNLFSKILLKNGNFLDNLKKLFHLFNTSKKDNMLEISEYKLMIPYLNGGLFRPDVLEKDLKITLKNEEWEDIFEFLNSYHWIIEDVKVTEENEERILTPEILGHVYERSVVEWEQIGFAKEAEEAVKSITERKKKGVYYTPESITEYISKYTIEPYLLDGFSNKYNNIDELIKSKNKSDYKKAINILNEIKILDPACGSGAFLIKASEVIFELKRRLSYLLKEKTNFYNLKLDIITENIYGVDILAGAVEISKLRLWLWLISDFEESKNEIQPLPNIEYNLKIGNSLVGWLGERLTQMPVNTPLTEKVDGIFTGLIAFSESSDESDLKKARGLLQGYRLNDYIEAYYTLYKIYRRAHGPRAESLRSILETIRQSIYSTVTPAFLDYINNKIKPTFDKKKLPPITKDNFSKLQVFHWRIDFGHIILNGGFDVIIGNPPYGDLLSDDAKKLSNIIFDVRNKEIAGLFVERSINLLKLKGYLSFIITYAITFNKILSKNREQIRNNFVECYISTFDRDNCRIFSDMTQSVSLMFCNKKEEKPQNKFFTSKFFRKFDVDDEKALDSIQYTEVSDYLLNKSVGVQYNEAHRLPKIGEKEIKTILDRLLKTKTNLSDALRNNEADDFIWIRISGNYWYNSFDKKPYVSSKFKKYYINKNLKDFLLVLMNSNIFYLWFRIFGDGRDMNTDILEAFPVPKDEIIIKYQKDLDKISKLIMKDLFDNFDSKHEKFNTSLVKSSIDKCDELLAKIYDLNEDQLDFILNYDSSVRGGRKL
jgi:hypothetical protein